MSPDLSSDFSSKYLRLIDSIGEKNINKWYFYDSNNLQHFIAAELSLKLSDLPVNASIFHYKTNGCIYNFIKTSKTEVFQRNARTNEITTLNVDVSQSNHTHININTNSNKNNKTNNNNERRKRRKKRIENQVSFNISEDLLFCSCLWFLPFLFFFQ